MEPVAPGEAPAEAQDSAVEPTSEPTPVPTPEPSPPKPADLPPAECGALLAQHFPALFGAGHALPIKLRVQADIQQRVPGVFSRKSLSIFLHRYTTSTPYIKALLNAPQRFDLDGQPAGEVAEEHRAAAAAELDRRQAIVQARRAAEREAHIVARRAARQAPAAGGAAGSASAPAAESAPGPQRPPRGAAGAGSLRRSAGQPQGRRADGRPTAPKPQHQTPRPPRAQRPEAPPTEAPPTAPAEPLTPEQAAEREARRSRAAVLRAYETTTLTRANFCALKGISDAALEAILVQARAEQGQRGR
ncbi:MAG: prop effector ProQ [Rubrivivax sp.]|nr:prop effector ProQ [Rubrivivax sp.]